MPDQKFNALSKAPSNVTSNCIDVTINCHTLSEEIFYKSRESIVLVPKALLYERPPENCPSKHNINMVPISLTKLSSVNRLRSTVYNPLERGLVVSTLRLVDQIGCNSMCCATNIKELSGYCD